MFCRYHERFCAKPRGILWGGCQKTVARINGVRAWLRVPWLLWCLVLLLDCYLPALAQGSSLDLQGKESAPISMRSTELLRRDLQVLAQRHQIPTPDLQLMGRQELGQFFLQLMRKLSSVPSDELTNQDYQDIGVLTSEFEDALQVLKGKLAMTIFRNETTGGDPQLARKVEENASRLKVMENLKLSGDFTFVPQSDFGKQDHQSMAANMRGRLNFLAKVREAKPEERIGDSYLFMRLTAASGRFFPRNKYLMTPMNAINDAVANPYNSGVNDVQVASLFINNNNSNSVRPTVSLEQAFYNQEMRYGRGWFGNYSLGLQNFGNVFDNNNYANNECSQFLNTSFVNSVSWRPNFIGPSAIITAQHPLLRGKAFIKASSGINSLADRDYFGAYGTNHELQVGHHFFNKEGNLRAGLWTFNFRSGTKPPFVTPTDLTATSLLSLLPGGTTYGSRPIGMYLNFDQKIWKDIGLWGRFAFNDQQFGEVFLGGLLSSRNSWSFGTEIPMKIFSKRRKDDAIGIAYGQIAPYAREAVTPATPAFVSVNGVLSTTLTQVNNALAQINPGREHRNEKIIEAYYRFQMSKNVSISPDIQYYWSPGATGPQPGIFVLSSRLNVSF